MSDSPSTTTEIASSKSRASGGSTVTRRRARADRRGPRRVRPARPPRRAHRRGRGSGYAVPTPPSISTPRIRARMSLGLPRRSTTLPRPACTSTATSSPGSTGSDPRRPRLIGAPGSRYGSATRKRPRRATSHTTGAPGRGQRAVLSGRAGWRALPGERAPVTCFGVAGMFGITPRPCRSRPFGVRYSAIVSFSAAPFASGSTDWSEPFPNVRAPTIAPRLWSWIAAATISAALAVLPSTSTASGIGGSACLRRVADVMADVDAVPRDDASLAHEDRGRVDGLVEQTARVAAQIEDHRGSAGRERPHLARDSGGERPDADHAHTTGAPADVVGAHRMRRDPDAHEPHVPDVRPSAAPGARRACPVTPPWRCASAVSTSMPACRDAVDREDRIARREPCRAAGEPTSGG